MYWWVLAYKRNGRPIIDGPHSSEDEADAWITEHIPDAVLPIYIDVVTKVRGLR